MKSKKLKFTVEFDLKVPEGMEVHVADLKQYVEDIKDVTFTSWFSAFTEQKDVQLKAKNVKVKGGIKKKTKKTPSYLRLRSQNVKKVNIREPELITPWRYNNF